MRSSLDAVDLAMLEKSFALERLDPDEGQAFIIPIIDDPLALKESFVDEPVSDHESRTTTKRNRRWPMIMAILCVVGLLAGIPLFFVRRLGGNGGNGGKQFSGSIEHQQEEVMHLDLPPGYKRPERQLSETYIPRGPKLTDEQRDELTSKWGRWNNKSSSRPDDDLFFFFSSQHPNRDVPRDEFPPTAWQLNASYLSEFLPEGIALANRALEAILEEYGVGQTAMPDKSLEERAAGIFGVTEFPNLADAVFPHRREGFSNAGWTTPRSYAGLVRRVLHAIVTQDTFTLTMGGHSASAGHGNHFQQSYTLQYQKAMEPVLERLGVLSRAYNFGMGGLGTIQNAMGAGSIYGNEIDVLIWDSGMTELDEKALDLFVRQASLSGNRVPIVWGGLNPYLVQIHDQCDMDVGLIGSGPSSGYSGLKETLNAAQAETLPWAARYVRCARDVADLCNVNENKFRAMCWLDRPDVNVTTTQRERPAGQVGWHPGYRSHQLRGRMLAFQVLRAVRDALQHWNDQGPSYILPDEDWHVTDYYAHLKSKLQAHTAAPCYQLDLPNAFCNRTLQARTEFTPRYEPVRSSLRSILKNTQIPSPPANMYDPPDRIIPTLIDPAGTFDYLNVVENGDAFASTPQRQQAVADLSRQLREPAELAPPLVTPGLGLDLFSISAPDNCDGTFDSFCGRSSDTDCLLYQHNDFRGGLYMDGYTGWVVLHLANVTEGLIVVKFETWHQNANRVTEGWTCENNNCTSRRLPADKDHEGHDHATKKGGKKAAKSEEAEPVVDRPSNAATTTKQDATNRALRVPAPVLCDALVFEFAIDGKITSWNKDEFEAKRKQLQRVVETWTLLDDSTMGSRDQVELAMRITGCGRLNTFLLTHVYWA